MATARDLGDRGAGHLALKETEVVLPVDDGVGRSLHDVEVRADRWVLMHLVVPAHQGSKPLEREPAVLQRILEPAEQVDLLRAGVAGPASFAGARQRPAQRAHRRRRQGPAGRADQRRDEHDAPERDRPLEQTLEGDRAAGAVADEVDDAASLAADQVMEVDQGLRVLTEVVDARARPGRESVPRQVERGDPVASLHQPSNERRQDADVIVVPVQDEDRRVRARWLEHLPRERTELRRERPDLVGHAMPLMASAEPNQSVTAPSAAKSFLTCWPVVVSRRYADPELKPLSSSPQAPTTHAEPAVPGSPSDRSTCSAAAGKERASPAVRP